MGAPRADELELCGELFDATGVEDADSDGVFLFPMAASFCVTESRIIIIRLPLAV